ncbi:hypothetical protein RHSIM_Rhsim11G0045400 [Rhododendron simsii]|uniref:GRF-type domain-containing protein n=1 Tax=Rhododendron simsii TaxID=118357 RepID=A0A834G7G6_RHOSS|nr:hypothetical protein RHSIM_Rhsim11G0045400 [Rhododendron simsii]
MSSSTSYYRVESETKKGVTNTPKLLYKPRVCYCRTRAEIKVVEKSEKSKGELYFICCKERATRCGFFDWCLPVEWTSSSKIGGWGLTEYTNVCASKVIDDIVALAKKLQKQFEMHSPKSASSKHVWKSWEVLGTKKGTQLTKVGWANVLKKFNEQRGKDYDRCQLKNQWGVLNKEWQLWQHLVLGESGLGRDPNAGAITSSEEWWDLKLMRHPECIKFREKPLPLEEEMRILFGSNTATNEHMHTPSSGLVPAALKERTINLEVGDIDALLDNDAEVPELVHPLEDVSKKRRVDGSAMKKGKGKKGTMGSRLEACMQQICDSTDSASSPSSVHRSAPDIPTIKNVVRNYYYSLSLTQIQHCGQKRITFSEMRGPELFS